MHSSFQFQIHPLHAYFPIHLPSVFFISFKTQLVQLWCPTAWGVGSDLEFGWSTRGHTIKEIGSPSPSNYQTPSASQLVVRFWWAICPSMLGFYLIWDYTGLSMPSQSPWFHMCNCPFVSLNFTLISDSYNLLVSSSPKTL